ncbi:MAG: hypothetical protein F6K41_38915, partial [Symploca sp. SIO3E6]|nr:hypothetical protein [Caldora sp. SIO3E6]
MWGVEERRSGGAEERRSGGAEERTEFDYFALEDSGFEIGQIYRSDIL